MSVEQFVLLPIDLLPFIELVQLICAQAFVAHTLHAETTIPLALHVVIILLYVSQLGYLYLSSSNINTHQPNDGSGHFKAIVQDLLVLYLAVQQRFAEQD
ncbi:MAG: hypothetical protein LBU14_05485 [Candidatus Peribacteria bacterium]|nr:hypothetical protein [Candidatus Peribacteria bacterium]